MATLTAPAPATTWYPQDLPVPCAARPSTGYVHLDGACRCFAGGPAPLYGNDRDVWSDDPDRSTRRGIV